MKSILLRRMMFVAAAIFAGGPVLAQGVVGQILNGNASGQAAATAGQQIGGQAGVQAGSQAGGNTVGNVLQGALNNGVQSGIDAAANAAVQGQGVRGAVKQGLNGAVEGAVRGNVQADGQLNAGANAAQSNASLMQGVTVASNGSVQFAASPRLSHMGVQTNDRIIDSNGRVLTDPKQIENAMSNASGFRVLRQGQIVELQARQRVAGDAHAQSQNMSVEQKLARIEQLVREIREELSRVRR